MQREGWLILKTCREQVKMPRWKLAQLIGSTESTISKWETPPERGGTTPDPDTVGSIEEVLETPGLWHSWMRATFDSYRKRHPERAEDVELPLSVMRVRYELGDVMALQEGVERMLLSGDVDQSKLAVYKKELGEALAAVQDTYQKCDTGAMR